MTEISILVAVYNDEEHLHECLDSLIEQTLRDIQIICIDDCSTDNSLKTMQEYALHDKRIEVIHLDKNQGQAKARNEGLKVAKGRYVTFLDSDDWLSKDALEKIVATYAQHPMADTVLLNVIRCVGNRDKHEDYPLESVAFSKLTGKEAFVLSLDWSIHGVYATRHELYNKFPYDDSCHAYSDDNTTRAHYLFAREVYSCDGTYFYRQNPNSVTNKVNGKRFQILPADESLKRSMIEWNVEEELIKKWENIRWAHLIDTYLFYFMNTKSLSFSERKNGIKEMRHTWKTIERDKIDKATKHKFGYSLMQNWTLFRMQEWLYFTIRGLLGRNKK